MKEESNAYRFVANIWPRIYKIINKFFYFLLNSLKKLIGMAIDQTKYNG